MNVRFENLRTEDSNVILPQLFKILYTNMTDIAPTGCNYEADRDIWLEFVVPRIDKEEVCVLLILVGDCLAGYFQYCFEGDILWAEEVEIKPEFQRTKLFYLFCNYLVSWIPPHIRYIHSYVHRDNKKSVLIHEHLGMVRIGENGRGTSWLYRGDVVKMAACLRR